MCVCVCEKCFCVNIATSTSIYIFSHNRNYIYIYIYIHTYMMMRPCEAKSPRKPSNIYMIGRLSQEVHIFLHPLERSGREKYAIERSCGCFVNKCPVI